MSENLSHLLQELADLEKEFSQRLPEATTPPDLDQLKNEFLGRKGKLQSYFTLLGRVEAEERPHLGAELNRLKESLQSHCDTAARSFQRRPKAISSFDPTLPAKYPYIGSFHPILQVMDEIKQIFTGMGFRIEEGPEIESEYYNFTALNIPDYHPSRDMQDTFYLTDQHVLRTHTSPVQIRTMEAQKPPVRMIAPGRCFRKDTPDATHSPTFHQVEGLYVDRGVSFADLKGIVLAFAQKIFDDKRVKVRFRPSFFPFTEPSAEYDFSCIFCKGKGCRFCKNSGWLEISGAGMVDPAVFGFVDYDPELYTGYAFGMGIERIALLKYQIHDIRILFENDLRFLEQF
jgi:phenylalanyl-tRNA synthetase alpha chain